MQAPETSSLPLQAVAYPEFLNIRPYMSENKGDPVMYGLYAVLVHSGHSCNAGHYYCYVKVSPGHSRVGAAGSGCASLQEALLQSPLACPGLLLALARGTLLVGVFLLVFGPGEALDTAQPHSLCSCRPATGGGTR